MKLMPTTRFGVLWRGLVAFVVVVACAAGAATTTALLKVKSVVDVINTGTPVTSNKITLPSPGAPQTLFLIGVDHRYGQGSGPGNTDTMMLVRIDSRSSTINLLSIPRDLKVDIPGVGISKINAAYADGGEKGGATLLLQTLQQQLFPGLLVNHVLVVDFNSFAKLITSIGCVYADVDHRYYNNTAQTDFSSINIQPGYQKLCGNNGLPHSALAFVRFRHNDSDLVREARQQDFLRWAKDQWTPTELYSDQSSLLNIFAKDVQSDRGLHTTKGLIELFNLALNGAGSQIKAIPFPVAGSGESPGLGDYLTFDPTTSQQAYTKFMTPTQKKAASPPPVRKHHKKKGRHAKKPPPPAIPAGLRDDPGDGLSQAGQVGHPGLPVYYPKYIVDDSNYCFAFTGNCRVAPNDPSEYDNSYPRHYVIRDGGKTYPSYVFTLLISMDAGEYYTVQGTTWQDPPILDDPSSTRVVHHRTLDLYSQGGQVTLVAWHTKKAVYWISNTLENQISNPEMVGMAASLARATA
jgi:polyisoprenyl-teichoic acid--peptidoglycan teichoic acid transferase